MKVIFEWTGEWREVKVGDYYMTRGGGPQLCREGDATVHSEFHYWILRRREIEEGEDE